MLLADPHSDTGTRQAGPLCTPIPRPTPTPAIVRYRYRWGEGAQGDWENSGQSRGWNRVPDSSSTALGILSPRSSHIYNSNGKHAKRESIQWNTMQPLKRKMFNMH